jgi:hypothetical protein
MSSGPGIRSKAATRVAQVWVELTSTDPEARSALAVARTRLAAGAKLSGLRRIRVMELEGALPERERFEEFLHRSTQFYNPHKESCVVRMSSAEPPPVAAGDQIVLVIERGAERRPAAERWWHNECGSALVVREGIAWVLSFEEGEEAEARARELAVVERRDLGLLCNPNSQDAKCSGAAAPLPWIHGLEK